jgi:hypothetical protein
VHAIQQWTETSAFFIWLRESPSIWAYPAVFFVHTAGLVFAAGASILIDARVLGAAPQLQVGPLAKFFRPVWIALWLTVLSGVVMVLSDFETRVGNRLFPAKMAFVVAAIVLTALMRPRVERAELSSSTRVLAAASLVCWLGAIAAGRFMAYFQ